MARLKEGWEPVFGSKCDLGIGSLKVPIGFWNSKEERFVHMADQNLCTEPEVPVTKQEAREVAVIVLLEWLISGTRDKKALAQALIAVLKA